MDARGKRGQVTNLTERRAYRFIDGASSAFGVFLALASALWLGFAVPSLLQWTQVLPKMSLVVKGLFSLAFSGASAVVLVKLSERFGFRPIEKRFMYVQGGAFVGVVIAYGIVPATWPTWVYLIAIVVGSVVGYRKAARKYPIEQG